MLLACGLQAEAAAPAPAPAPAPDPLLAAEDLYRRIRARYRPMYDNYAGLETRSRIESRIYDSETNELRQTSTVVAVTRNYFAREREMRVLEYTVDGEARDPSEHEQHGSKAPVVQVWDSAGPDNYRLELLRRTTCRGEPCYLLRITPKRNTERHFDGTAEVAADTLDLLRMQGTMADLPFGVDGIEVDLEFQQRGELAVVAASTTKVAVDVPIVFPDRLIISKSTTLESRGIPR